MKKLGRKVAASAVAVGVGFGGTGCGNFNPREFGYDAAIANCDADHWGDKDNVTIQSGPSPRHDSPNLGAGDTWESEASVMILAMPKSPATKDKPLRVRILNGMDPDIFGVTVEVFNPDTNDADSIAKDVGEIDINPNAYDQVIYSAGENALRLTTEYEPPDKGGAGGVGAEPPYGHFTVTCVQKPA